MMRTKQQQQQQQSRLQQLQVFLHANTRSLHQRLIAVTVVVLCLSGLILLHSLAYSSHAANSVVASPAVAHEPDALSFSVLAQQPAEAKKNLIDLTPPLSRQTLGHATWSLLHTMAALYPEEPSLAKQAAMRSFLESLGELYPCVTCASHFRQYLAEHPLPTPLTRDALAQWLCESHNAVNVRLEKVQQECSATALTAKWPPKLQTDCGCSVSDEDEPAPTPAAVLMASAASASTPSSAASPNTLAASSSPAKAAAAAIASSPLPKLSEFEEEEQAQRLALQEEERRKANEHVASIVQAGTLER